MTLMAPGTQVPRSTDRSMPRHGDRWTPTTERHRRQGPYAPGLRQAGDVVDLDYPPFFVDRVEDALAPGPQAPQIRRPVRERLRRPRLIGELTDGIPERRYTDGIVAEEACGLV